NNWSRPDSSAKPSPPTPAALRNWAYSIPAPKPPKLCNAFAKIIPKRFCAWETAGQGIDRAPRSFSLSASRFPPLSSGVLTIRNLKKSVGGRTLFEDAAMQVNYAERVALVGPNGAGKSTLFSLILKHDEPDAGTAEYDEWITLGYLP